MLYCGTFSYEVMADVLQGGQMMIPQGSAALQLLGSSYVLGGCAFMAWVRGGLWGCERAFPGKRGVATAAACLMPA